MAEVNEISVLEMTEFAWKIMSAVDDADEHQYDCIVANTKKKYGYALTKIMLKFVDELFDFGDEFIERESDSYNNEPEADMFAMIFGFNSIEEFDDIMKELFKERKGE